MNEHTKDPWSHWRANVAGKTVAFHEDTPEWGFYRKRNKEREDQPVAIFGGEDGALVAIIGLAEAGRTADPLQIWTWVCKNPISQEVYDQVARSGLPWPDADPVVDAQVAAAGHNSGEVDEAETLKEQIEAAKAGADSYAKITDDETLAKAQSLRARLNELSNEADNKRTSLKAPHLEAGRAVDAKWQPLVKSAKAAADKIRDAMGAWETEKLRKQREAERQAEQVRLAAERKAQEAEAAGKPPIPTPEPTAAPAPAPAPTAAAPIKGSYGKAASVARVNVVTGINDQAALYAFLKDHPDLKACMFDLAKRAVAKGHDVPGVTVEEQAKVS